MSFDRPYAANPYGVRLDGAGDFLRRWEYNALRFLEREGYDVTCVTDVDTHQRPIAEPGRRGPRIFLSESGALVFAVGSMQWNWGLTVTTRRTGTGCASEAAQQVTRTVLTHMQTLAGPRQRKTGRPSPIVVIAALVAGAVVLRAWLSRPTRRA